MTMDNEELKRAGAAVQLWWMTQKHEPLSQEDGCDIARAVFDTLATPADGLREVEVQGHSRLRAQADRYVVVEARDDTQ